MTAYLGLFPGLCKRVVCVLIAGSVILGTSSASALTIESTFTTGPEGWKVIAQNLDGTLVPESELYATIQHWTWGGPDLGYHGYLAIYDPAPHSTTYWSAPDKFLGDKASLFGHDLTFHLRQMTIDQPLSTIAPEYSNPLDVVLSGGGITIYRALDEPGLSWTAYSLNLSSSDSWMVLGDGSGDDVEASDAEIMQVLGSLEKLWIKGEYSFRAGDPKTNPDYPNNDGFMLSYVHVPEPITVCILTMTGSVLIARRSRMTMPV